MEEQKKCRNCPRPTDGVRVLCDHCSQGNNNRRAQKRKEWAEASLCMACGAEREAPTKYCSKCRKQRAEIAKRNLDKVKDKVYESYGGYRCQCCGETEKTFLSIDHVNNDGAEHRKQLGNQGKGIYWWFVKNKFPEGFQVLCMNCQFGKARNGGICPHQMKR